MNVSVETLPLRFYARGFGPLRLMVMWHGGTVSAVWTLASTGARLWRAPVGNA